ncbi:MAG TPA: 50S ribosomal protein L10 [archaeon]|nr:50S ribosomal protein L10 [archaeon]
MTSHTRKWKESQLSELKELVSKYNVIAVADIRLFPASLFMQIRKKLHGKAVIKVSKTKVLRMALKGHNHAAQLTDFAQDNCAVIFTNMNPFELFGFLKKNKGKVAAKVGAIADDDIIIPAGDTGLPPGPALSDLKGAGLKVAVQGATIAIMEDKVVTKKGEAVSAPVAGTLSKLNVMPFKVGMKLIAAIEGSQLFRAEILDIDTEKIFANFMAAHRGAFNVAVHAGVTNKATIEHLVSKAFSNSKAVALEGNVLNSVTAGDILAKAERAAKEIKSKIKEDA